MICFWLILALIFFAMVCLWRREWGIYLIILLLPTYQIRFQAGFVPMTFLEGLIIILALIEFFFLLKQKCLTAAWKTLILKRPWRSAFVGLFLFAAAIGVFISPATEKAGGIFKAYFLESIVFFFLILLIIDNERKLAGVWKSLAVLVLYLSGFGLYQFFTLANLPFSWWAVGVASRRITSVLNHPNALALLLGPALGMLIAFLLSVNPVTTPASRREWHSGPVRTSFNEAGNGVKKQRHHKLMMLSVILGLAALYLSFSRAAWLALAITLVFIGLFTPHKKKMVALVIVGVLLITLIPYSREKLIELANRTDPSQQNRYVLWSAAADIIKHHPIAGAGLMGFHEAYKNYPLGPDRVVQNYPHNFFLNFWVEIGLAGLLAMLGMLYVFGKKIRYLLTTPWRPIALVAAAGMSVLVLHGLVDVSYFKNDLSVLFWLIYALPNLKFLTE